MKNLSTLLLALFLTSIAFAQIDNVEPIPPMKDGLREQFTPDDYQNLILREKLGEIPFQGGIVDQQAQVDALVNNNAGAGSTANFTQSETDILAFGSNVLIGFNDSGSNAAGNKFTGWSYSTDGGATFTDGGTLPTNTGGDAGDPVLARDENTGRIYFSTLGYSVSTIQVFRSDDNGLTWMAPVNGTPGGGSEDKQWITVDNFSGPGNGNVYLITRSFGNGGIFMYRSTDNGNTFGPNAGTLIVSGNQGAFVAVGPDHSVYAFWYAGTTLQMRKSTDQGVTFGSAVTVVSGLVGGVNGDLGLVGIRQGTSTASSFRSNQFPHAAVNPVSGHIYVTYDNDAAGTDKADVFMKISTDGGTTWGASTRVNDDATTTDQWQPTIAVTPDGVNIGIFYYSRQEDTANNNLFKYYGRTGTISGSTVSFTPSFAISDVASLPEFGRDAVVNSVYMGDYNHAVATANEFHVVWSDNRDDLTGGAPRKDPNVYYEKIILGPPCPVGVATNPNPASGTTNVSINLPQVTWTNGAGATSIEVFFNGSSVYSGAPVTSYSVPGPLTYSTTYGWRVNESNGTCTTYGPNWTFTTMQDPNLVIDTVKIYPGNGAYWTGTCTASAKTDTSEVRGANSEDGWIVFDVSGFPSGTIFTSAEFFGFVNATYFPYWSLTPMGTIDPRTATASEIKTYVQANSGSGTAYIYSNESSTFTTGWHSWVPESSILTALQGSLSQGWFACGMDSRDNSATYYIEFDGWAETNVPYLEVIYQYTVPVELTSFTANAVKDEVKLNWATATETNNQGFQVEKMNADGTFEQIGYLAGFGTTTEPKAYSFTDSKLDAGTYTYRLKQIDFDGSFEYSDVVEVEVSIPAVYALEQNYPNPFNPSTTINYSIAEDGFVKLAIYNMLGEEVATIVNTTQKAGKYEVNFNASKLSSGVYVYRIEATNFTASKKLMLLK
jgi:hypothetical protein